MVETALVMVALCAVLFGIMDFGRLLYTYHLVDNAARLGARFAIVRGTNCSHYVSGGGDTWPCPASYSAAQTEITNYVQQQSIVMGLGQNVTVNPVWNNVAGCTTAPSGVTSYNNTPGCQVAVTVSYTYNFWFPFMPKITGGIPLTSTSEMLISQ